MVNRLRGEVSTDTPNGVRVSGRYFIATVIEIKRFGSSGEGEAVVQVMVWASSMLKFLRTVL